MSGGTRIAKRFADLKAQNRAGLIAFVTAGDPDHETSAAILNALPGAGADMIELGLPFSDPMADGPAIQASSQRALKNGASVKRSLELVTEFRKLDDNCPIILMGYFNPIYIYGAEKFLTDAKKAGVDGLIIVDLPPEEDELLKPIKDAGLDLIYLAAPTTDKSRLPTVISNASGYLYYVSITGITGTASADVAATEQAVAEIRKSTDVPIAVGFGIKTPEQAAGFAAFADGVIVGSALVNQVVENIDGDGKPNPNCVSAVTGLVAALAEGVRGTTLKTD